MYRFLAILFSALIAYGVFLTPDDATAEVRLMMAEEPGCMWCARWNDQIAPIYPKTGEGTAAPLLRVNITETLPADISLRRRINYTPTFVLLVDGVETNRIEGYPGEDFFWGLLGEMLKREEIPFQ